MKLRVTFLFYKVLNRKSKIKSIQTNLNWFFKYNQIKSNQTEIYLFESCIHIDTNSLLTKINFIKLSWSKLLFANSNLNTH